MYFNIRHIESKVEHYIIAAKMPFNQKADGKMQGEICQQRGPTATALAAELQIELRKRGKQPIESTMHNMSCTHRNHRQHCSCHDEPF